MYGSSIIGSAINSCPASVGLHSQTILSHPSCKSSQYINVKHDNAESSHVISPFLWLVLAF